MRSCSALHVSPKKQQGLNLIELMIAVVIGLFISLMVVQYLSTSSRLFKQQGADSNLEANGAFAISYMSQFIRQAGSHNPMGSDVPFYIGDCGGVTPCTFNEDTADMSDQVAIQMVPQNLKDCANNDVVEGDRIANVFSVSDDQLFCRGYNVTEQTWLGTQAESLIDGVEQLQVLYGVSNAAGVVDRYVDASRVASGVSGLPEQIAWDAVRSVKIAVLVADRSTTGTEKPEAINYQLLDSPQVTRNDRVSRKVYSTTVTINNKLP